MSVLPVMRMGATVLKQPAAPVTEFGSPELGSLAESMVETMHAVHGIGLAAPQVGVAKRMVVFYVPAPRNGGVEVPITVLINPVIVPLSGEQAEDWEACLSVPGLTGRVPRYTAIRYRYQDLTGATREAEARDFHARVVQHECDHLDGILYPMRMRDMSTLAYVDALKAEAEASGQKLDLEEEGIAAE